MKTASYPGLSGSIAAIEFPANHSPGHSPDIVALHGWLDNAASFIPLMDEMKDMHCSALDFPGHGLSDRRPEGSLYHLMDYVADVQSAIVAIGGGPKTLIGHSLGAGIACLLAAGAPDLIGKLVLIDGLGPLSADASTAPSRLKKFLAAAGELDQLPDRRPYPSFDHLVAARRRASTISESSAKLLMQRASEESPEGVVVRSDARVKTPSPLYLSEAQVEAFLRAVSVPVLLVVATEGVLSDADKLKRRVGYFNEITVVELEGGHHLHMDSPALVARSIKEFL
ncbi:MAG: alpha/beta hydrolase [Pseudomonadota bacterium]